MTWHKPRGDGRRTRDGRRRKNARPGGTAGGGEWLYGRRPVVEALRAGKRRFMELRVGEGVARAMAADPDLAEIGERARQNGVRVSEVARDDLDGLLGEVNHQGVALLASPFPYAGFDEILRDAKENEDATVLLLDHIEDPQNVGSLLRTADAAGVAGVVLPENRSAGVTPAAARASAGAAEHVKVAHVVNLARAIDELKGAGCWITGLDAGAGARPFTEIDFAGRCGLVVGNEGKGMGRLVREKCDFIARIPMAGAVASLNAAVAGAIVIYEAMRRKHPRESGPSREA